MNTTSSISIRRARREDVEAIVKMLADDPLGRGRERIEHPLPHFYFDALDRDPRIQLVAAEGDDGAVIGCLVEWI